MNAIPMIVSTIFSTSESSFRYLYPVKLSDTRWNAGYQHHGVSYSDIIFLIVRFSEGFIA
jgi:hypothetical protein